MNRGQTFTKLNSLNEAFIAGKENKNPYILGGAEVYKQAIAIADKLDLTFVHHNFEADAFFPEIDTTIWEETSREDFKKDESNKYDYSFVTYLRKRKEAL